MRSEEDILKKIAFLEKYCGNYLHVDDLTPCEQFGVCQRDHHFVNDYEEPSSDQFADVLKWVVKSK